MGETTRSNVPNRTIFCHDNLEVLQGINTECIDLIYLDPPFNKKKIFTASIESSAEGASFKDIFTLEDLKEEWVQEIKEDWHSIYELLCAVRNIEGRTSYNFCYLAYMAIRLIECYRVLKNTGSIYLHCDPTMSHYLKLLLDCIFGEKQFRNEIVWIYRKWNVAQDQYPKNHDVILFYTKSKNNNFNTQYLPKSEKSSGGGRAIKSVFDENTGKRKSIYTEQSIGTPMPDWFDVSIINPMAYERTGYPTQKPLVLLERIIKTSSNAGDMVLDPFCGCATTCVAAEKLDRHWIGVDISVKAYELVKERIVKEAIRPEVLFEADKEIRFTTAPPQRSDGGVSTHPTKYVYVISHPRYMGEYKVGIASNVNTRLTSYQTADPDRAYKLEFSMETPYYRETEAFIHTKYENKHEWVHGALADIIKDIQQYKIELDELR